MNNLTNICIRHLPPMFEKQDLCQIFSKFGKIKSCKMMFDLKTGKPKNFGFVRFESSYSAMLAIENLNGQWISKNNLNPEMKKTDPNSRKVEVSYAMSSENFGTLSNEIVVSSLPLYFKKKDIFNLFSVYGQISSIKLINDLKRNRFHGKASIKYKTNEEAEKAIQYLNNIKLTEDSWPLFIQFNFDENDVDTKFLESDSYQFDNNSFLKYGIKIKKPAKKQSIIENKINQKTNDTEYFRNQIIDNYMFKMIAEEL